MESERHTVPMSPAVSLVVEVAGEGDSLVLLPSFGCSTSSYHPLITRLIERGFRTIAVNVRGIGGSTGPLDDLTVHDLAADVVAVIRHFDLGQTHVIGWAWGSGLARCVAADAPQLVETVVLLAGGGGSPDAESLAALSRLEADAYVTQEERMNDLSRVYLSPASDPILGDWFDIQQWPAARAAHRAAANATPPEDWFAAGSKPMLVILGQDDRFTPPESGYALKDELGDSVRVVVIPDAGHGLAVEQPETVAATIDEWVHGGAR